MCKPQVSHRSSENAEDTSAEMHQGMPALSASGKHSPSPNEADRLTKHTSTGRAPSSGVQRPRQADGSGRSKDRSIAMTKKQSLLDRKAGAVTVKQRRQSSEARQSKDELVAETKGRPPAQ